MEQPRHLSPLIPMRLPSQLNCVCILVFGIQYSCIAVTLLYFVHAMYTYCKMRASIGSYLMLGGSTLIGIHRIVWSHSAIL